MGCVLAPQKVKPKRIEARENSNPLDVRPLISIVKHFPAQNHELYFSPNIPDGAGENAFPPSRPISAPSSLRRQHGKPLLAPQAGRKGRRDIY